MLKHCETCMNNYKCKECKYECCHCPMWCCTYTKYCEKPEKYKKHSGKTYHTIGPLPKI